MTAATVPAPPVTAVSDPAPGRAVSRLAMRRLRLGAVIVALICGFMSAMFASQFHTIITMLNESGMQAMAGNPIEKILLGPPLAFDDPGGFAVWRTGTPVLVLASGWIVLVTTRLTRGDEDAGRWSLLLAGRLRITDVVIRILAALAGSAALIGVAVAAALLAARTEVAGALIHATGITCVALTFATVSLLAAQVMPGRSGATGLSVVVLGVALLLRMIADGSHQMAWLAWTTPFGLAARAAPYADNRVVPLLVLGAFPIVLAAAAVLAARHRDVGAGIIAMSDLRRPRTRMLQGVGRFALRRAAKTTVGWAVGVAASFLLAGALLASVLEYFQTNPRIAELAAEAGVTDFESVNVFVAPLFGLLAVPTGLYAVMRLATLIADERAGRWTLLFTRPISRERLVSTEIIVTVCGVMALHCTAAVAVWSGTEITGAPLQLTDSLAGALNSAPVALLAVGAAAAGAGWFPSAVAAIGAFPIVGGFLVNVVMQATPAPRWVVDLSPWSHLAPVPDTPPNWAASAILLIIVAIMTALGVYGYARRDLAA